MKKPAAAFLLFTSLVVFPSGGPAETEKAWIE